MYAEIGSVPLITKLLGNGLSVNACFDDLEIKNGLYFGRGALLPDIHYNVAYMFDPVSIGVVEGETKVRWDGID